MPTENRSIPIHADDEAAILKMHSAFLDRPAEERADASIQLQDEAYALGRARGKTDQAEQHQGEIAGYRVQRVTPTGNAQLDRPLLTLATPEEWGPAWKAEALYTRAEPAEVGQLRKEAESYKQHTLSAAITIGQICEALGIDDHSEPDMIIEAAKSMADGLNRIVQECPLGTPGFAIACEVLGELGVQQEGAEPCNHQFTDDGQHLLVCTDCGYTEDHDPHWRPMETAPTDGTIVRLLVEFEENSTEDDQQAPTIGHNSFKDTGEDEWQFAGWNWQQDCYTSGQGMPVGWLPLLDPPAITLKL